MMNLPAGAQNDEYAPFNINEKVYKFSVEIIGDFYYEYHGTLDMDELDIARLIRDRIESLILTQGDIGLNELSVDID